MFLILTDSFRFTDSWLCRKCINNIFLHLSSILIINLTLICQRASIVITNWPKCRVCTSITNELIWMIRIVLGDKQQMKSTLNTIKNTLSGLYRKLSFVHNCVSTGIRELGSREDARRWRRWYRTERRTIVTHR